MGIGMAVTSLDNTLVIHAIGAPIFFAIVSLVYFRKFNFTKPLPTAVIFVAFVIAMDVFVVAMLINRSFEMFTSLLGTWIPFALIFVSTWLTGLLSQNDPMTRKISNAANDKLPNQIKIAAFVILVLGIAMLVYWGMYVFRVCRLQGSLFFLK
jgi:hypothetical protein